MTHTECRAFRIEERRPVWLALSNLFLDTDTSLLEDHIVATLSASPYTVDELEGILIDEVYPACRLNMLSVAGVWEGFDPEWLEARIMRRRSSPSSSPRWLNLGRLTVPASSQWRRIKRSVRANRQEPPRRGQRRLGSGGQGDEAD